MSSANTKIHSLQAIRAIAAWLVIIDHAVVELSRNQPQYLLTHIAWALGSSGVYVFFVISGFIMVHICWDSFGRYGASSDFLRRRLIRIMPLYWLATIAALAYHRVSGTHSAHAGWHELARSLTFIPYPGDDGVWAPILRQGWTLSYEMMFYSIFALGLSLSRRIALPLIGMTLGLLVVIVPALQNETLTYLASPIVLWFLLGMVLAALWRQQNLREPGWLARPARYLEVIGDASYSTYLTHGLVLTMLIRIWRPLAGPPSIWLVPVGLVVATVAGWAVHMTVERPLLRLVANAWKPRQAIGVSMPPPTPPPHAAERNRVEYRPWR
jgi:exopolysaccharide production protein ExoZ